MSMNEIFEQERKKARSDLKDQNIKDMQNEDGECSPFAYASKEVRGRIEGTIAGYIILGLLDGKFGKENKDQVMKEVEKLVAIYGAASTIDLFDEPSSPGILEKSFQSATTFLTATFTAIAAYGTNQISSDLKRSQSQYLQPVTDSLDNNTRSNIEASAQATEVLGYTLNKYEDTASECGALHAALQMAIDGLGLGIDIIELAAGGAKKTFIRKGKVFFGTQIKKQGAILYVTMHLRLKVPTSKGMKNYKVEPIMIEVSESDLHPEVQKFINGGTGIVEP